MFLVLEQTADPQLPGTDGHWTLETGMEFSITLVDFAIRPRKRFSGYVQIPYGVCIKVNAFAVIIVR